jgi:hypothetical protein
MVMNKKLCPVCNNVATPLDVVDFNKCCEEARGRFLPICGIPIYYYHCSNCSFTFAPEFEMWTEKDFLEKIYNDEYTKIDPDYLEVRPQSQLQILTQLFGEQKNLIQHLDYGGGNGKLSLLLRQEGWNSATYDPYTSGAVSISDLGTFNLITAFEVFEHVADIHGLMKNLTQLMSDDSLVLFSTLISDGNLKPNNRINWWYASPRNGHISLFSQKSLILLGKKYSVNLGTLNDDFHCYCRQLPHWARHSMK